MVINIYKRFSSLLLDILLLVIALVLDFKNNCNSFLLLYLLQNVCMTQNVDFRSYAT